MDKYTHYSREDLISEIERLKMKQAEGGSISSSNKMMVNMIVLRKTISDVLSLLLSTNDEAVIDKALLHILHFFDVERVYIGIFDEQSSIVDFTHEVTSEGIISMREDSKTSSHFWPFRFQAKEECTGLSVWTPSGNIRTGMPSILKTCGYWPISYP